MIAAGIEEGLRMLGRANAHYRTGHLIGARGLDYFHPLAEAHRNVGCKLHIAATRTLCEAMAEGTALYDHEDPRSPEDWRREGERAARAFAIGVAFAESLEERAQLRRRADAARREAMSESTRILVVEPHERPALRVVEEPWVEAVS